MTAPPRERRPPSSPRRSSRRSPLRVALTLLAFLFVLLVGISVGRALEDGPSPGGVRTDVRTLVPRPLPPAERTVTVTVTE